MVKAIRDGPFCRAGVKAEVPLYRLFGNAWLSLVTVDGRVRLRGWLALFLAGEVFVLVACSDELVIKRVASNIYRRSAES